ncbi:hypothetical protein BACUNI_03720 [Bacteroides uniformis ATCC 8492]|uniref:Uncharacterized protein n=1 Tax=Bacteroides uniformis (strain ATCC 8492 / DSM 6597 / CCUG 4942 / CIP 103695 / JCM 5828 / KCTC 5204 / NCTC 13054 / VPI 0061) TaxID=411479 RepID=A0ABC9N811_BACUC|nr:hypothetical protein BACUNI_03720 [Bacteroides uniformis ATCC 8492]
MAYHAAYILSWGTLCLVHILKLLRIIESTCLSIF